MSFVVVTENGPACPRCGRPMQVREHDRIREKQLQQPFYYSRWFCCMHKKLQDHHRTSRRIQDLEQRCKPTVGGNSPAAATS